MGFRWGVYAKVNGMVCALGAMTYALAAKPEHHQQASADMNADFLWAYVGALLRNGAIVVLLTLFTASQQPITKSPGEKRQVRVE